MKNTEIHFYLRFYSCGKLLNNNIVYTVKNIICIEYSMSDLQDTIAFDVESPDRDMPHHLPDHLPHHLPDHLPHHLPDQLSRHLPDQLPNEHVFDIIPLVYNDNTDTSAITNVLLIDNTVQEYQQFVDGCNATTFPIVYDYHSDRN
jgi:hypothetical protein